MTDSGALQPERTSRTGAPGQESPLSGADSVVLALNDANVEVVFGMPGVHTLALYEALARTASPRHVLVRHEQAAAFAADGYGRITGRPGVCLATTGPGAFNMIAALGEAYNDSSPVVALVGQIPVSGIGRDAGMLHEVRDQGKAFEPVTKAVWRPRDAQSMAIAVAEALHAASSGRPRPVYVEMPFDLLEGPGVTPPIISPSASGLDPESLEKAATFLSAASHPVILAGGGVNRSAAYKELAAIAEALDAPVVMSVNGLGAMPSSHALAAGTLTRHNAGARKLVTDADALMVIGCRLDANTTSDWTLSLPPFLHVDVDDHVVGLNYEAALEIIADAKEALAGLHALIAQDAPRMADGRRRARVVREGLVASLGRRPAELAFMQDLRAAVPEETVLAMDATQMSGWASAFWPVYRPAALLFPFGSATLGFALPAAVGAAIASPESPVIAMLGDSGLLFSVAELATVCEQGLPLTTVVFNNRALGSIRDAQAEAYGRSFASEWETPDFVDLAHAFRMSAERVDDLSLLSTAIAKSVRARRPHLIEVVAPFRSPWSYQSGMG